MTEYLTSTQVAALCGRSERTIARWRKRPDFPKPVCVPFAGRIVFDGAEIERFLRSQAGPR